MVETLKSYTWFENIVRCLLKYQGVWPDQSHSRGCKIFMRCFAVTIVMEVLVGGILFTFHHRSNIMIMLKGIFTCVGIIVGLIKLWTTVKYEKELEAYEQSITRNFKRHLEVKENQAVLLHHYPVIFYLFHFYFFTNYGTNIFVFLSLLINHEPGKTMRLWAQHFPFSYTPGGLFDWGMFVWEAMCTFACVTITTGFEGFFSLKFIHLVGELKLLSVELKDLKVGKNYKKDLKAIVERHVELIEAKATLEKIFGFPIVWQAVTAAGLLCLSIYQYKKLTNVGLARSIYLLHYVTVKLIQTYLYTYFGTAVITESEACMNSVYESDWIESRDKRVMKDMLIILSQKPMNLTAMSLVEVNMNMFVKILKTAVSYFCLLQTLETVYDF